MPRRTIKKVSLTAELVDACRIEIEKRYPPGSHPLARGDRLGDAAVVEISMNQALKLNCGMYDQMLLDDTYSRLNLIIARKIAEGIAAVVEGAEVRDDSDGWPEVIARVDGEPAYAIPMQREYLKPAGRVMN